MNWLKSIWNITKIKDALLKIYTGLSTGISVLRAVKDGMDAAGNKKSVDVGKVIDLCVIIISVLQKILVVLGVDVPVSASTKATLEDIDAKIRDLKNIEL